MSHHRTLSHVLCQSLLGFVGDARGCGYRVGLGEEITLIRCLAHIDLLDRRAVYILLRSLLCSDRSQWQDFADFFQQYWAGERGRQPPPLKAPEQRHSASLPDAYQQRILPHFYPPSALGQGADCADSDHTPRLSFSASWQESLRHADFQSLTQPQEIAAMERCLQRLARQLRQRLTRRYRAASAGGRISLRHSLRCAWCHGGDPIQLRRQQRRRRDPDWLLIIDVSRSMAAYTRFFLWFARAMVHSFARVRVVACHTRLLCLDEVLAQAGEREFRSALVALAQGWDGGTRLGDCLADWNDSPGKIGPAQYISRRSMVLIFSDGLDSGSGHYLAEQLQQLKQRHRYLVWLNPLLGRAGYEPRAQAMHWALPHIDVFRSAHNFNSLLGLQQDLLRLA